MEKTYNRGCTAQIGSVTAAMRAQRVLATAAIPSQVVKVESSRHGCAYGLSFSCEQLNNVRLMLQTARISVKQWNTVE